jgi:hypothetical protein
MNGIDLAVLVAVIAGLALMARIVRHDMAVSRQVKQEVEAARANGRNDALHQVQQYAARCSDKTARIAIESAVWSAVAEEAKNKAAPALVKGDDHGLA